MVMAQNCSDASTMLQLTKKRNCSYYYPSDISDKSPNKSFGSSIVHQRPDDLLILGGVLETGFKVLVFFLVCCLKT